MLERYSRLRGQVEGRAGVILVEDALATPTVRFVDRQHPPVRLEDVAGSWDSPGLAGGAARSHDGAAVFAWKTVEVLLPTRFTAEQVIDDIHARIRICASDAGEFVQRIHIRPGEPHPSGFTSWTTFYQLGPPAPFPSTPSQSDADETTGRAKEERG